MVRPLHIWAAFGVCLAVVLVVMGWTSLTMLRLEQAEAQASRQAAQEESVRLALWRMESALGPVIAQESGWPYFAYRSFYAAQRAYGEMFGDIFPEDVLVPSPLLTFTSPYILVHFQIGPDGKVTSPQVPDQTKSKLAANNYAASASPASATQVAVLHNRVDRDQLLSLLSDEAPSPPRLAQRSPLSPAAGQTKGPIQQQVLEDATRFQQERSMAEQAARSSRLVGNVDMNLNNWNATQEFYGSEVSQGTLSPVWVGDMLLLARRVSVNGDIYVQGCRLNWLAIEKWLAQEVADLLPAATLEPVRSGASADDTRMLAALPVRLLPGDVPVYATRPVSSLRLSLIVAWLCLGLAAAAVVVLLTGTISLSERRAAFVSAVTHEMRTPLTTFRMYTEMLTKGMVPDENRRTHYLNTLRIEANRLSHLVENVLAYARIERSNTTIPAEPVTLGEVLDRTRKRLAERAAYGGMELYTDAADATLAQHVRADTSAVEQVLFNLVDNACKYAVNQADKRIHLEIDHKDNRAVLRIRDHGPGVAAAEARRLFRPFSKSARDAANSAPGVGLGLALSRRLARGMGGELALDRSVKPGACFVLTLPGA